MQKPRFIFLLKCRISILCSCILLDRPSRYRTAQRNHLEPFIEEILAFVGDIKGDKTVAEISNGSDTKKYTALRSPGNN